MFSSFRSNLPTLPELWQKVRSFFTKKTHKKHPWFWGMGAFLLFIALYLVSSFSTLRIFLPHFAEVTGFPLADKNYLIVFQNNNELRPAGGFISAYGILKFRHGFYEGISIADVYGDIAKHPYQKPPYPMDQLLADPSYQGYTFRDANYDPDYPKSAQELVRMLHLTKPNLSINGVIAVNYTLLEDLLQAIGPLKITTDEPSPKEITFSKDTLFELLESQVHDVDEHNLNQLQHRKDILALFSDALLKKVFWNPLALRKVSDTIVRNFTLKNIQLYFQDPALEKIAVDYGWAGQWPQVLRGDFLAVDEANLGGLKSDRYLQRKVTYHLAMEPTTSTDTNGEHFHLIAEVTIDLYHYGIENIPLSGDYKGFFRTYVPRGAKLLDMAPSYRKDLWETDEDLFHVFGNIVKLKPGEKTELFYRYELPEAILHDENYSLFLAKQSGTLADDYSVIVEAPQGYGLESSTLIPRENFGIYEHPLQTDLELEGQILPDRRPPHIVYQTIENSEALSHANIDAAGNVAGPLARIALAFNENIANAASEDPLNYTIEDSDQKHPEHHDELTIDHIEHDGKRIVLAVKGMTHQPDELYTVTLKNIEDTHGNMIDPNPRTVTVVQR